MEKQFVTVYVLCYNSAKTITETLDSIASQTYNNLDLLISDDASIDNSLQVIDRWLKEHRKRFRNVSIETNETNQGINYNFDRCVKKCQTEWLKIIAADDMLIDTCIENNIDYVTRNNIKSLLYSQDLVFTDDVKNSKRRGLYEQKYMEKLCKLPPEKQYRCLLKREIFYAPTTFINTDIYRKIGGISTKIKNIEDSPLALSFTSAGYSIYFMDVDTAYYRIGNSVSHSLKGIYNKNHLDQVKILRRELIYPSIKWYDVLFWYEEIVTNLRYKIVIDVLGNKDDIKTRMINVLLMGCSLSCWKKAILKFYYQKIYRHS